MVVLVLESMLLVAFLLRCPVFSGASSDLFLLHFIVLACVRGVC